MKKARFISALLALLFVTLSFAGCYQPTLDADEIIAKTDKHIVYRVGNLYYMEFFHDFSKGYSYLSCQDQSVEFESLSDMRSTILEDGFSDFTRWYMWHTDKDGIIEITDTEHLWQPVYPEDVSVESLKWFKFNYDFELTSSKDENIKIEVTVCTNDTTPSDTAEAFEAKGATRDDSLKVPLMNVENSKQYIERFDVLTYDAFVRVYYTLQRGELTYNVIEYYSYSSSEAHPEVPAEDVPGSVAMWITGENLAAYISISGFETRPTEEWLLSFGMEPYVSD
ncbi:MAG: hypothetical protein II987_08980 [Clostridia bacterium]|nr:hypothetical protein [Clostridia bacterium]